MDAADRPTPAAAPEGIQEGDRVKFEGEVRRIGKESALIRFWSGSMFQLVWVELKRLFKADSSR